MKFNSFWCGFLTALAVVVGAALILYKSRKAAIDPVVQIVTEVHTDTVFKFVDRPVLIDSVVLRYVTVRVPIEENVIDIDTTLHTDSIPVVLPITQKVYQDSTYTAWVSGYEPSLDSIAVYQPVTTISNTITITETSYKPYRWSIGVQAGIGAIPNKVEPYIGIGVSYNIFSW